LRYRCMKLLRLSSFFFLLLLFSCNKEELSNLASDQIDFPQNLSAYNIYIGDPNDLIPNTDYVEYELGSALFTDYADKQRLIKIPEGSEMKQINNGLPSFPDGTIIVKTFFYYFDKGDPSKGKRVIETRLLVKEAGLWNVADYLWNDDQSDGILIEDGYNTSVNYIDENGQPQVIGYHVPSIRECATCHAVNNALSPIGPKLRSMNIDVDSDMGSTNQLAHFQSMGILEDFEYASVSSTPNFENQLLPIDVRGRAYLDANCAHCHNALGFAADQNLFLDYETPFEETNIDNNKWEIKTNLEDGTMPHIGATVIDKEGVAMIIEYINSL
jgi:uncharacterized repeat protein (TIGR03806 family)